MGEKMSLLPCPFCGSQPKLLTSSASDERYGYNFTVSVRCQCGAQISKPSHEGKGGWCDDKGEAKAGVIVAWNARYLATPAQTVDVEAVREVINDMQEWLLPLDIGAFRTKLAQAIGDKT